MNGPASALPPELQAFFRLFLDLDPRNRRILLGRLRGEPYQALAAEIGKTTQCAEQRHKKMLQDHPQLARAFRGKLAKQRIRKRHQTQA